MYDYRQLTPEQRVEVVAHRISRSFPWHKPPHPDFGNGWYFITGTCYEHKHHFREPSELTEIQHRLFEAIAESHCECGGWVVLPNHYHLLVKLTDINLAGFGRAIGKVHGRSGLYANRRDNTPKRQVWFKYSDRKIRSERHYWACLHYLIMNPVKHGHADDPLDWPWSAVHELVAEHGPDWLDSLRRDYPLTTFGDGWDD
ncbi:MAG: REP-associated tyrosine transposase [Planctomycetaceae bacterium]